MKLNAAGSLIGFAILASLSGCAETGEETGDEAAILDGDIHYDETISSLTFTGAVVFDAGTTCNVAGVSMHCCPNGWAMVGAHIDRNVLKCAQLTSTIGTRFQDSGTVRNDMHACPLGTVMVGLHVGRNLLTCLRPNPQPVFEFVDGNPGTSEIAPGGFSIHICPPSFAMSGIRVDRNHFTCAQ